MALPVPRFLSSDRFTLVRRLGSGGMGVVYEVSDQSRGDRVALKTLRAVSDGDAVLRFKHEFRALQDVQHHNLVTLLELGQTDGQLYFTMELIDGQNLLAYCRPDDPNVATMAVSSTVTGGVEDMTVDLATTPPPGAEGAAAIDFQPVGTFDEKRLRASLEQLLHGLGALHAAKKVHRDLKPSNVLCTTAGRVVILDFGVISDPGLDALQSHGVVGTAAYMAPEQALGGKVGPEADVYSLGVVLYQALTGRLPFSGNHQDVLALKQRIDPPSPRTADSRAPADLDRLCMALLARDPAARPTVSEALRLLGATVEERTGPSDAPIFVGRETELAWLAEALKDVRAGRGVSVVIEGESGVGKSALVREMLTTIEPDATILSGRCYERESVPYKAIDGVIDALSLHLIGLAPNAVEELLPAQTALLGQVFPVLRRVEAVNLAPRPVLAAEPQQQRLLLFTALRELLTRLARKHLLVVVIDDLQWADSDSRAMLAEVLRPPQAPPFLLLGTTRPIGLGTGQPMKMPGDVRHLLLQPLLPADARQLAVRLLDDGSPASAAAAERIADEAAGHPLFIDELCRRRGAAPESATAGLRLEDALWYRIERLPAPARALLELVAIAGSSVSYDVAAAAATAERADIADRVQLLASARLLRTTGIGKEDVIETYHDRVRESLQARLTPDTLRAWHARLAIALETSGKGDLEALAIHWREAGEAARAFEYLQKAALEAEGALAFDRAARLYRQSLDVNPLPNQTLAGRRLREQLGLALANAGRGAEAARALLEAADSQSATAAEALELRRRGAEQYLRAGHIDDGLAALRSVLAGVGMSLPKTPNGSLVSLLWRRAALWFRGLEFTPRDPSEIAPIELQRIDVCLSTAVGLGTVDTIRGADFQARSLQLALKTGEKNRIARALAMEAGHVSASGAGSEKRVAMLIKRSQELAAEIGDPHTLGVTKACEGIASFLLGRWRDGTNACEIALPIFRDQCTGVAWEMTNTSLFHLWSLSYLGELTQMREIIGRLIREAEEYGNRYAATNLRTGSLNFIWLCDDDPPLARHEAQYAMGQWTQEGFHHQHWDDLLANGEIDLYIGDGKSAYDRVKDTWPALQKSLLLMIQLSRVEAVHLRGRAALAKALLVPASERKALLKEARRDGKSLHGEKMEWAFPYGDLLYAGAYAAERRIDLALPVLERAITRFRATDTIMYMNAALWRKGQLVGGDEGRALTEVAERWFRGHGVRSTERFVTMLVPGFPSPQLLLT